MSRISKYIDIVFLVLLGTLLAISIEGHFRFGYVLTVNFYLGFISWLYVLFLRIKGDIKAKAFLICLLTLGVFNIISFTIANISFGSSTIYDYKSISFALPGVNPVFILILICYTILDFSFSINLYNRIVKGSEAEIDDEYKKEAKFYYEKFSNCTQEELDFAVKSLKEYPKPAQDALEIVISKRKENL